MGNLRTSRDAGKRTESWQIEAASTLTTVGEKLKKTRPN